MSDYFLPHLQQLQGYTPGEQPSEGGYIKLNTNENPYPPSPRVLEAIQQTTQDQIGRYPEPLADRFRNQAASILNLSPEWIMTGNGCDDLLTIITRSFADSGKTIRFPYPGYILYETLTKIQNAKQEAIPFLKDWSLNERFLKYSSELGLVFFANPNSPSGILYPKAVISQIIEQLSVPVVIDEAYVDFANTNCMDLVHKHPNLIVTRTLSKSYSLAGLRFGYAVAQPEVIRGMQKVKDSYNCDILSIVGASAAFEDQQWMVDNVKKICQTREHLIAEVRKLGFQIPLSQANFIWCTLDGKPTKQIYEQLRSNKILVRYLQYKGWGDGLRISVGTDAELEQLLDSLRSIS